MTPAVYVAPDPGGRMVFLRFTLGGVSYCGDAGHRPGDDPDFMVMCIDCPHPECAVRGVLES